MKHEERRGRTLKATRVLDPIAAEPGEGDERAETRPRRDRLVSPENALGHAGLRSARHTSSTRTVREAGIANKAQLKPRGGTRGKSSPRASVETSIELDGTEPPRARGRARARSGARATRRDVRKTPSASPGTPRTCCSSARAKAESRKAAPWRERPVTLSGGRGPCATWDVTWSSRIGSRSCGAFWSLPQSLGAVCCGWKVLKSSETRRIDSRSPHGSANAG